MTEFQNELGTRQDRVVAVEALSELVASLSRTDDGTAALFEGMRARLAPGTLPDLDDERPHIVGGGER
jgi:hypothetical protein